MVRSLHDVTGRKKEALLNQVLQREGLYREWRESIRSGDIEHFVSVLTHHHIKHNDAQWNHLVDAFAKAVEHTGRTPKHTQHFRKRGFMSRNFHSRDVAILLFAVGLPAIAIMVLIVVYQTLH